jgi:hypothetical protein
MARRFTGTLLARPSAVLFFLVGITEGIAVHTNANHVFIGVGLLVFPQPDLGARLRRAYTSPTT